jgi:hypothetical protein
LWNDRNFVRGDPQKPDNCLFNIVGKADDVTGSPGSLGTGQFIPEPKGETKGFVKNYKVKIMDKHDLMATRAYERSCAHAVELKGVGG